MGEIAPTAVACKPASSNGTAKNARDDNMIKFCGSNSVIDDAMK